MIANEPLVSIVTPCLNPGEWLDRCLATIDAQTYPNIEHIIIDGGSTDGTAERLPQIDGIRWISEPDTGQSNAINKGFAMATGQIIGWLNADDEFLPDAIEQVVRCFDDPAVGVSYGNCELIYEDKQYLWVAQPRLTPESFDWGMAFPQQGWFVTRWALDSVGPLDESFNLSMDFDMCIRLNQAGIKSCRVPSTLARFYIHSGSKTGQSNYADFIFEGARALKNAGRMIPSYMALGQSCAHAVKADGVVPADALRAQMRSLVDRVGALPPESAGAIDAGARVAAGQIEAKANPKPLRALRWIARPAPWRFPLTRRLIPDIIKTSLVRWAEGSRAKPLVARLRGRSKD